MKGILLCVVLSFYLTIPQTSAKLSWKCQLVDEDDPGIDREPPKCRKRGLLDRKLGRPDRNGPGYIVDSNQTKYIKERRDGVETFDMPYEKYNRKVVKKLNDLNRDPGFDHSSKDFDGRPNDPETPHRPSVLLSADEINKPVDISLDGASLPDFDIGYPGQPLQNDLPLCPECEGVDIYAMNKYQLLKYYEECRFSVGKGIREKILKRLEELTEPKMPKVGLTCDDIDSNNMSVEEEQFYYDECYETKTSIDCDTVDFSSLPPRKRRAMERRCGLQPTIEPPTIVNRTDNLPRGYQPNCTDLKNARNSLNPELAAKYLKCMLDKCSRDVTTMNVNGKRKFRENCVLPGTDIRLTQYCIDRSKLVDEMSLAEYARYENECLIPEPEPGNPREIYVDECENDDDVDVSQMTKKQFREYRENCLIPINCGEVIPEQLNKKQRMQYREICDTKEVDCRNNAHLFKSRAICIIKPKGPITIECDAKISELNNLNLRRYVKYCIDCNTPIDQLNRRTRKIFKAQCKSIVQYPTAQNITCDTDINTLSIEERKQFVDKCVERCVNLKKRRNQCVSCQDVDVDDLNDYELQVYNKKCVEYPKCLYHQVETQSTMDLKIMSKNCIGVDGGVVTFNETIKIKKDPIKHKKCYGVDLEDMSDDEFEDYKMRCVNGKPRQTLSCKDTDYNELSEEDFDRYVDDCVETKPTTIRLTEDMLLSCTMDRSAVLPRLLDVYDRECGKDKKSCEDIDRTTLEDSELVLFEKLCGSVTMRKIKTRRPKLCSRDKERLTRKMIQKYELLCETPESPTICDNLDVSQIPRHLLSIYQSECGTRCFDQNFETMTPRELKVYQRDCYDKTGTVITGNKTIEVKKKPKKKVCYDRDVDSMTRKEYANYLRECFDGQTNSCENVDYQSLSKEDYEVYVQDCVEINPKTITLTQQRNLTCGMSRSGLNQQELDQLRSCLPPHRKIVINTDRIDNPPSNPDDDDEDEKIIRVRNNGTDGDELTQITVREIRKHHKGEEDTVIQEPTEVIKIRVVKQAGGKVLRRIRLAHKKRYHELPSESNEEDDDGFQTLEIPKYRKVRVRKQKPTTTTTTIAPVIEYYYDYVDEPYTTKMVKHRPGKRMFRKRYIPRDEGHIIEKIDEGYVPEEVRYEGYILLTVYPMNLKKNIDEEIDEEVSTDFQRKYKRVQYPGTDEVKKISIRKNPRKIVNRWTSYENDEDVPKGPARKVLYEVDENGNEVPLKIIKENNVTRVQRAEEDVEITDGNDNIVGSEKRVVEIDEEEPDEKKKKRRIHRRKEEELEEEEEGEEEVINVSQNNTVRKIDGGVVAKENRKIQIDKNEDRDDEDDDNEEDPKPNSQYYVVKRVRNAEPTPDPKRKRIMKVYMMEEDGTKTLIEEIETEWTEEEYEEIIYKRKKKKYELEKDGKHKKLVDEEFIEEEEWEEILETLKKVKKYGVIRRKQRRLDEEEEDDGIKVMDEGEGMNPKTHIHRRGKKHPRSDEVADKGRDWSPPKVYRTRSGKKHRLNRNDEESDEEDGGKETVFENKKKLLRRRELPENDEEDDDENENVRVKENTKRRQIGRGRRRNNREESEEEDDQDSGSTETITRIVPGKKRTYKLGPNGEKTLVKEEDAPRDENDGVLSGTPKIIRGKKRTYKLGPNGEKTLVKEEDAQPGENDGVLDGTPKIIRGKKRTYKLGPNGEKTLVKEEDAQPDENGVLSGTPKIIPGRKRTYELGPNGEKILVKEEDAQPADTEKENLGDERRINPGRRRRRIKNRQNGENGENINDDEGSQVEPEMRRTPGRLARRRNRETLSENDPILTSEKNIDQNQGNLEKHPLNDQSAELGSTKKSENLGENGKGQQQHKKRNKKKRNKKRPGPSDPFQEDEVLHKVE